MSERNVPTSNRLVSVAVCLHEKNNAPCQRFNGIYTPVPWGTPVPWSTTVPWRKLLLALLLIYKIYLLTVKYSKEIFYILMKFCLNI